MAHQPYPLVAYTRADARRSRPGRGPARATSIRFFRADCVLPDLRPARSPAGRYLYLLPDPLLAPVNHGAARQVTSEKEVG
jgi:hypothetical protein